MKLYLLYQDDNRGYETYDSAVVAAEDENAARSIHPRGYRDIRADLERDCWEELTWTDDTHQDKTWRRMNATDVSHSGWATCPSRVEVQHIGEAACGTAAGVICASYNAG